MNQKIVYGTRQDYSLTDESVARAKAERDAERLRIRLQIGFEIGEVLRVPPTFIIHCPECGTYSRRSYQTDAIALRGIEAHLRTVHGWTERGHAH